MEKTQPMVPPKALRIVTALYVYSDKNGRPAESAPLLAAMARAIPDRPEMIAAQARMHMISGDLIEARSMLDRAVEAHPKNAIATAMLALCMYVQKDSLWQSVAQQVLALPPDSVAQGMLDALSTWSGVELKPAAGNTFGGDAGDGYFRPGLAC